MKKILIILFVYLANICCLQDNKKLSETETEAVLNVQQNKKELDSIKGLSVELKGKLDWVKKENPSLITEKVNTKNRELLLFHPFGLTLQLRNIRAPKNTNNFLCIPAAFTSKQNKIEGLFIRNGIEVNTIINKELTGACIISNDSIQIISFEDIDKDLIAKLKSTMKSVFQQALLIKNNEIIPCDLFKDRKNLRRALVKFKDSHLILESCTRLSIREFQEALIEIGVISAIYLDMGTWSEGWYKNNNCEIIKIGETMFNTPKQTNWLIYSSK